MRPRHLLLLGTSVLALAGLVDTAAGAGENDGPAFVASPAQVGHVFPHMTVMADGVGSTSETGIGALIPWANRLWAVGYVAHIQGSGIGLYEIGPDMSFRKHPASVTLRPVLGSRTGVSNGTATPPTASTSVRNAQKSTWTKWSVLIPKFW